EDARAMRTRGSRPGDQAPSRQLRGTRRTAYRADLHEAGTRPVARASSPPRSGNRQAPAPVLPSPRPPFLHHALKIVPHEPSLHALRRPPIRALLAGEDVNGGKGVTQPVLTSIPRGHDPRIIRHDPRLDHVRVAFLAAPQS